MNSLQITTLNVMWTFITFVGTLMSGRVLYEFFKDYRVSRLIEGHDVRKLLAQIAFMGEFSRFFTQLVLCALGVLAIINPIRFFTAEGVEVYVDIITGVFIAVALVLMVTSVAWNIYRKAIVDEIAQGEV
jgi:hypothetical protein